MALPRFIFPQRFLVQVYSSKGIRHTLIGTYPVATASKRWTTLYNMSGVVYNCRRLVKNSPQCLRTVSPTWLGSSRKREYSVHETSSPTAFLGCIFAWPLTKARSCAWAVVSISFRALGQPSTTVSRKPQNVCLTGLFVSYPHFDFTTSQRSRLSKCGSQSVTRLDFRRPTIRRCA